MQVIFAGLLLLPGSFWLLPSALGRLLDEALFDGRSADADVAHFAINDSFHALKIREEAALCDCSHVRTDTALFLGLTAAPNVAAFDGPFSS